MVAGWREVDKRIRAKLVKKMMGSPDEAAAALLTITVNAYYAFFIAIRLVGAELATIYCVVGIDFALHLRITYLTIKENKKDAAEIIENTNKKKVVNTTKLVLAELIEGLTPMIYGICMALAYYGPNSNLFANVGSSFWGREIEDISQLFYTMFLLFSIDTISVVVNSLWLWKAMRVNMLQEFYRVLKAYWLFMSIKLGYCMCSVFATTDVNFGLDGSGQFKWIYHEGWQNLIWNSNELTNEEKLMLLANTTMI